MILRTASSGWSDASSASTCRLAVMARRGALAQVMGEIYRPRSDRRLEQLDPRLQLAGLVELRRGQDRADERP
jgi:hypothetical protein